MANVTNYEPGKTLPAIFADFFGSTPANDDLTQGVGMGFPYCSIKGKSFTIVTNGEAERVMNDQNLPAQFLDVVLVKAAPNVSKVFYMKGFTDGSEDKPDCSSNDGIRPDAGVPHKQCDACASCKWNQWGSRVSEDFDSKGKACQDVRRVAMATMDYLEDPMLVRVPPTTLKPMAEYGNYLAKKGVPYQAVVTRLTFDPEVAYPKLQFKPVRFLTNEEAVVVRKLMDEDIIKQITGTVPVHTPPAQEAPIQGNVPDAFAAGGAQEAFEQVATPAPAPAPAAEPPSMFEAPPKQTKAAPAPAPVAEAPAQTEKPKRRGRPAASAKTQTVAQEQPAQAASGTLPNGAAHAGVTVMTGDVAGGVDTLLGGLPDVPNI